MAIDFLRRYMKPILACLVLSLLLLSAQTLDLRFGLKKRSPQRLPPSQVVRLFGFPTHGKSLMEVRPCYCSLHSLRGCCSVGCSHIIGVGRR